MSRKPPSFKIIDNIYDTSDDGTTFNLISRQYEDPQHQQWYTRKEQPIYHTLPHNERPMMQTSHFTKYEDIVHKNEQIEHIFGARPKNASFVENEEETEYKYHPPPTKSAGDHLKAKIYGAINEYFPDFMVTKTEVISGYSIYKGVADTLLYGSP